MYKTVTFSKIIAFDGHDGVGKTTIAKALEEKIGAIYLRPFEGTAGIELIKAANASDYQKVIKIGKEAILHKQESINKDQVAVFDRHWHTVLSLLPENLWVKWSDSNIKFVMCCASLKTVKERLSIRREQQFDDGYHKYYLQQYLKIANKYDCIKVNTDITDIDESVHIILENLISN